MAVALDRQIRKVLERAVREARGLAEDGARKSLMALGVEDARRPTGLAEADIDVRNQLRAHARSLGDVMASDDSIKASRLVREIAYEHWHRALFARFLAENSLLMEPEHKVAVSLTDMEEIAKEEGRDPVELAADWAEPMLPQIFRKDDPALALALPPETRAGITDIVKGLPRAVFVADDLLGWAYQFWQADNKERINEFAVLIGADELPAVTQLFTEDYMVLFLLENTLGAWWAAKMLGADPALASVATSEDELREKTSPSGYRWSHLRFVREPRDGEMPETATGPWRPAAGAFEGWPAAAKEITLLDPCMGSGHFLVFALPILVALRRAEEGLDERAVVKAVLADNLFGLEIDPRCTQIAAFALALASWKRIGGPDSLPRLNLACSGLSIGLGKDEFLKLAERIADASGWTGETNLLGTERTPLGDRAATRLRGGLERLYEMFERAPYLGSLIEPHKAVSGDFGNLFEHGPDGLEQILAGALERGVTNYEVYEAAVTAQGIAKAVELLARRFTLVITNVPYLGRARMSPLLKNYCVDRYKAGSADLATSLIERFTDKQYCETASFVGPQALLFLGAYKNLRHKLLTNASFDGVARLGARAFETVSGEVVSVVLLTFTTNKVNEPVFYHLDANESLDYQAKNIALKDHKITIAYQSDQLSNPSFIISARALNQARLLNVVAPTAAGMSTFDSPRFIMKLWEVIPEEKIWSPMQTTVETGVYYSGLYEALRWEEGKGGLFELVEGLAAAGYTSGIWRAGSQLWGTTGVNVSLMGDLPCSIYIGTAFSQNCAVLSATKDGLPVIWTFCESSEFNRSVREIDRSLKVTTATVGKISFDFAYWQRIAAEKYPNGLPKPYSNDPTQWLFDGHPRGSADPNVGQKMAPTPLIARHGVRPGLAEHPLQIAVARLLGYRWPRQTGWSFMDCPAVTEPDEVDCSGLIDSDGIVPLPAVAGKADAATRLRDMIRVVWGSDYVDDTLRELLGAEDAKVTDLGAWLADEFFDGHCRLFHQTPFIWHIWDGVRGGFSALVNAHRLCEANGAGRRLLEKLRDSYLGEWIGAQRRDLAAGEAGAEARLIAAEHLRGELTRIIEGNPPYDIFVRWKPLHRQPIGWEPDIDDGVRLNIRPFLTARPKDSGRRDGCILRVTPRVKKHAGADRGTDPKREKEDFPWFWAEDDDVSIRDFGGGPEFKGRRYNDFHYSREYKLRARAAKGNPGEGRAA